MALGDPAAAAPQPKRAAGHKLVQLLCHGDAADAVECVGIGGVYLMKILGGAVPRSRHDKISLNPRSDIWYYTFTKSGRQEYISL